MEWSAMVRVPMEGAVQFWCEPVPRHFSDQWEFGSHC
jgi:hypothetical protein